MSLIVGRRHVIILTDTRLKWSDRFLSLDDIERYILSPIRNFLCLMASVVRQHRNIHVFTYKSHSVSDRWCLSLNFLELCILSPQRGSYYLMHGVNCQTATECTYLCLRESLGVWQMALIIKYSWAVHTFTSKRFSVPDGWYQSSDCHGMHMPSLTDVIRCLTDGLNQRILSTCTYFLLQVTLSVWQVLLIVI